jgi:multidrug resistance efflux pump
MPEEIDTGRHTDDTAQNGPMNDQDPKPGDGRSDPLRKWTLIVLAACGLLLVWQLASDRITPYTSQARVKAYVVPVAPQVAGLVTAVNVENNQLVSKGEVLLEIDDTRYRLALESAQADLDTAGQDVGAGTAGIQSAEANVAAAMAELSRAQKSYDRVQRIYGEDPGAVSKSERDFAQAALEKAHSGVAAAEAELDRAKQELGQEGSNNPRLRASVAALEQARFDLTNTKVRAPTSGLATDLRIDQGYYAQPGQALMTFIAIHDVWIEAYFRENSLGRIKAGDRVELALDIQPGRVFAGKVASLSAGISTRESRLGDLPDVEDARGWLRDAQRFPVIVAFDESFANDNLGRRVGSQVDVIVYTGNNTLLNAIGWMWIRIVSFFSYAY